MSEMNVVYCIRTSEGKVYVGSTQEAEKRLNRHMRELKEGCHHNSNLQLAFDNDETFSVDMFTCNDRDHAYAVEEALISVCLEEGVLLNIGLHSRGGDNLTHNPRRNAIIEQIQDSLRERLSKMSAEERKEKWGHPGELNGMWGKTHTAEVRQRLAALNKGNKFSLGRKASDETKQKLSVIASQRLGDKNSFYGKQHSDETKRKIAVKRLGIKPVNTNRIEINGEVYASQSDAAIALGVSAGTITHRLNSKNPKYSNYRVITQMGPE
jgi:group I intron endonuclease